MSQPTSSGGSLGFSSLLTLIFITLKLTHVIDWSWWWVLAPTWISTILFLSIFAIGGVVTLLVLFFKKK